jgi:hypothetical protein
MWVCTSTPRFRREPHCGQCMLGASFLGQGGLYWVWWVSLVGVNPICIPNWGHGCLLNQYMDVFNKVFSSLFYDVLKHIPLPCTIWLVYATLYKLKWHPSSTVWFQNSSVIVNVCSRIYLECRSYQNRLWKRMDAYFSYMPTIWMSFKTHKLELCFIDNARHALMRSNIWYINCWALAYPAEPNIFLRVCTHTQTIPISNDLCPPMPTHSMTWAHPSPCPPKPMPTPPKPMPTLAIQIAPMYSKIV